MSGGIVVAVLFAALLHAIWNAIAKGIPSRLASSALIALVYLVLGAAGAAFLPHPAPASWGFIAASCCLQTAYLILLTASYRHGDFSQVYPVARGLAVLLVALVSTVFLAEHLGTAQLAGVLIIGGSLLALAFTGPRGSGRKGIGFAVLTGICIAAYSLVDGEGVRHAASPFGYVAWVFLLQGALIPAVCWWLAPDRRALAREIRMHWPIGAVGGILSLAAYTIVVWAQSIAPLALVSALRETSVLLAGILGLLLFGERFRALRMTLTATAVVGIIVLQLG